MRIHFCSLSLKPLIEFLGWALIVAPVVELQIKRDMIQNPKGFKYEVLMDEL